MTRVTTSPEHDLNDVLAALAILFTLVIATMAMIALYQSRDRAILFDAHGDDLASQGITLLARAPFERPQVSRDEAVRSLIPDQAVETKGAMLVRIQFESLEHLAWAINIDADTLLDIYSRLYGTFAWPVGGISQAIVFLDAISGEFLTTFAIAESDAID